MSKRVLLITDMAGQTKVAMTAMMPVLSEMGYNLFNLPTAIVSNNFAYGDYALLDTTDYIRDAIRVWQKHNFTFDAVATGIVISHEQLSIVKDFCKRLHDRGVVVFSDPIMADDGALYNGISDSIVEYMRDLIGISDYIVPNYTELCYLAGIEYTAASLSQQQIYAQIDKLREYTKASIVVTSAHVEGRKQVCCYDARKKEYFSVAYDEVPVSFSGTGDIFCAVFMGHILKGDSLKEILSCATRSVQAMVLRYRDQEDKLEGLPVESCLDLI